MKWALIAVAMLAPPIIMGVWVTLAILELGRE